jgi:hypothetical protein
MRLSSGSRLGPYEILSPLGAKVKRARDTRPGLEVAVKVLPASFSQDWTGCAASSRRRAQ